MAQLTQADYKNVGTDQLNKKRSSGANSGKTIKEQGGVTTWRIEGHLYQQLTFSDGVTETLDYAPTVNAYPAGYV